ncbi:MAG: hypothetical protein A2939_05625 [Parcubacteria group bacterium RIFCSPLOWO2_01_FULL_48_18]|nr:MAG: hypothetical protein A3J67_00185 [Parcubacteria group bacterium RIFCSPHIGHO2_02_FULL_48_10b]OHB23077.1 MAG: hypothetical protein A2939_05625 [Parcubacteria group bacterium RIFCSPLOWO2_01_FULL_48_18]
MSDREHKICQNCKGEFVIDAQDFLFYEKIEVPAPTFCPQCRLERRLAFLNVFSLYKRPCDLCKKEVISIYAPDAPYTVYCPPCWWSDDWDPLSYGKEYDFFRPFFEQLNELWHQVPLLGLSIDMPALATSPYNNHAGHLKDCYLLFHTDYVEDSAYGYYVFHSKSVFDSSLIDSCEWMYDSMNCWKVNRGIGLVHQVTESVDCYFLRDCRNCQNCFASANLRNKRYYIFNQPYTKEQYFEEIKKWDLGSYAVYQKARRLANEHFKKYVPKARMDDMSVGCTGNYVFESKNCYDCREVIGAEDCKYMLMASQAPIKDSYDVSSWGNNMQFSYECCNTGEDVSDMKFCQEAGLGSHHIEYGKLSSGAAHHFGCVSVRKRDYCILNKQYSKDEFEKLREKIIRHMNEVPYVSKIKGQNSDVGVEYRYGEFLPPELSPFAYNETMANEFFPLSEEEAGVKGYRWRSPEIRQYAVTMTAEKLPDHIKDAPDSILNEIIQCANCSKGFRIIPMELDFLRRMNVPLPRECPFCRVRSKFRQWVKNMTLVKRTCSQCNVGFETSYTKEEYEHILCSKCYLEGII